MARSSCYLRGRRLRLAEPRELLTGHGLGHVLEIAVRNECDPLDLQPLDEGGDLARFFRQRAARVDHACEEQLVEAAWYVVEMGRVEVDADRFDGQVRRAALQQRARVAELE